MFKPIAFANALAVVGIVLYIGCRILTLVVPDLLFAVGQSWFHTFNLEAVRGAVPMDIGAFLLGGITFGVLAWVTGYAFGYLYNNFAKKT
ncbi:MAG TPA: DUF5676 family membrane protein [Candidatus Nanoarchaeia archaeon]|nr:DUF5676 family membrane protein [Candidatus Nanoarchaeia archaeon]